MLDLLDKDFKLAFINVFKEENSDPRIRVNRVRMLRELESLVTAEDQRLGLRSGLSRQTSR